MSFCLTIAKRSEDSTTQVGSCLVNSEGHVIGLDYNRMPKEPNGNKSLSSLWSRDADIELSKKYYYGNFNIYQI